MYSIMCIMACTDEVVKVEYASCTLLHMFKGYRVNVMDGNTAEYPSVTYSKVAALIPDDYQVADPLPFG